MVIVNVTCRTPPLLVGLGAGVGAFLRFGGSRSSFFRVGPSRVHGSFGATSSAGEVRLECRHPTSTL
jgi:hypothetical protein